MTIAKPALLCLNTGSSSVKFSLYAVDDHQPQRVLSGQMEGLLGQPRFKAVDAQGTSVHEAGPKEWKIKIEKLAATV